MKIARKIWRNVVIIISLLTLITLLPAPNVLAQNANPGVIPPKAKPYGMTYGEWSAEWWKWVYSMPIDAHPLFDTADCSKGQKWPVWFLGGTFATSVSPTGEVIGQATHSCTIPTGKALFFPVLNGEASTLEGNGQTKAELESAAKFIMDHALNLQTEVDGKVIQNLGDYRNLSPLFTYELPSNNVLYYLGVDAPAGATSPAVGDGVYLMLAPLPKGDHTIHFGGEFIFTQENGGFDFHFIVNVTYHLTVASPQSGTGVVP